jgi:hypothetical protein
MRSIAGTRSLSRSSLCASVMSYKDFIGKSQQNQSRFFYAQ